MFPACVTVKVHGTNVNLHKVYMLRLLKDLAPPNCMCGLSRNTRTLQTANIT